MFFRASAQESPRDIALVAWHFSLVVQALRKIKNQRKTLPGNEKPHPPDDRRMRFVIVIYTAGLFFCLLVVVTKFPRYSSLTGNFTRCL